MSFVREDNRRGAYKTSQGHVGQVEVFSLGRQSPRSLLGL